MLYSTPPNFCEACLLRWVGRSQSDFLIFMTCDGMDFFEIVDAICDGMYTDNYANTEVCNVCDGNFVKDPDTQEFVSATKLLKLILHGNKKTIRMHIECDPVLHGGGEVPCNFDNVIMPPKEIVFFSGCFTRFATDHKLKKYLEEKGEEDVEEQAQNLEEDSEVEDDD